MCTVEHMSYWGPYEDNLNGGYPGFQADYAPYYQTMSFYGQEPQDYNPLNQFSQHSFYDGHQQGAYMEQPGPSQVTVASTEEKQAPTNNGTVKKKTQNKNWNYSRRPGSGRTFNRTRPEFTGRRGYQDTADVLRSYGYNNDNEELKNGDDNIDLTRGGYVNKNTNSNRYPNRANNNFNNSEGRNNRFKNNYGNNSEQRSDVGEFDEKTETVSSNKKGAKVNGAKSGDSRVYQNSNAKQKNYYEDKRNNYRNRDNRYNYYENRNTNYGKYQKNGGRNYENGEHEGKQAYGRDRNWRNDGGKKCRSPQNTKNLDAASQRERLEQMLSRRMLECLVCCEKVKHTDKIWTCQQCYHILHLNCITAWANSSKLENGWRCPACQNVCSDIPKFYLCYCGKTAEPRPVPGVIPHACGEPCMKKCRNCEHKCPILCHPGPCPDCNVMVTKSCGCGSTTQSVKCSSDTEIICNSICGKLLECGVHQCQSQCHVGNCNPCEKILRQECFCGKVGRKVSCTAEFNGGTQYACEDICGKQLSCGNHKCQEKCHEGECEPCPRDVALIETCPCGRSKLKEARSTCLDPIPCCEKICGKVLKCGQPAAPHTCKSRCHEGPCPTCSMTTLVRCRCGHMDKEMPCAEVTTKADDARCEKKCTKKRLCGRHRCNQRCCIAIEHICPLPCNHTLSCGQHRCERTCHSGRCPPCLETSFEELYCECGASVLYPPIPCGTRPPPCDQLCSRQRPCGHEANHTCHTGSCPPCTVLCKRWCHGKHEQRSAVPCYQENFSCGLPCGKPMPCGSHKCDKPCHTGSCPLPCKQKCQVKRSSCGHACGLPCHQAPCPETTCKASVPISCPCGLQKGSKPCNEVDQLLEVANYREKMADLVKDQPVDISDLVNKPKRPQVLKIMECTEECRVLERNRRLAIGLQIRNPDLTQKLTPRYSDFMRNWAKKDPQFCQRIHDKLTELVQLAKQSKQKSRSHSFETMNKDKRHFVHEYCEHFGCESAAYDAEPNRNIVATAIKDKSWLPSMSLMEIIQRENGQRKVPGPVLSGKTTAITSKSETTSLKLSSSSGRGSLPRPSSPPKEPIDYFDNPPI